MFNQQLLQKEEEDFRKLTLAPEQRQIVEALGKVLIQFIEIPLMPTLGFIWRAIKAWQMKYKRSVSELSTSDTEDRVNSVYEMTQTLKVFLKKVVRSEEDSVKVDDAVNKMFNFYKSQFSNR